MTGTSINRNIVECKGNSAEKSRTDAETVLIETLWNVKFIRSADISNEKEY